MHPAKWIARPSVEVSTVSEGSSRHGAHIDPRAGIAWGARIDRGSAQSRHDRFAPPLNATYVQADAAIRLEPAMLRTFLTLCVHFCTGKSACWRSADFAESKR